MADPGVSGQNFLRLLLGGAQKGVDQIPQQQAQQADLAMALQRMMQQKQQFDTSQTGIQQRHTDEQTRLTARGKASDEATAFRQSMELRDRTEAGTAKTKADQSELEAMKELMRLAEANPELSDMFDAMSRTPSPSQMLGPAMNLLAGKKTAAAKAAEEQGPASEAEVRKLAGQLIVKWSTSEIMPKGVDASNMGIKAMELARQSLGLGGGGLQNLTIEDIDAGIEAYKARLAQMGPFE